jgi:DNA polymerase elongation subunit (family B)
MMLHGSTYFKGLKLNQISYLSFDIENLDEHNFDHKDLVVLISNTFRNNDGKIVKKLFSIKDYPNSVEMVQEWCRWVKCMDPDVVLGHNIILHDLRIMSLVSNLNIGRDGSPLIFDEKISKIRKDAQQQYEFKNALVFGREVICTWMLSIKYDSARLFPSYGLKSIEKYLGLVDENRIEWDFTKNPVYKTLNNPELWNEFTKYSIDDADGPLKMVDIMLPSLFYLNQTIPQTLQSLNITNTGSQINNFLIRSYLQFGSSIPQSTKITEHVAGGISFAVPGIYRNLYKIDIKSCYPSQILRFKLYDHKKDPEANYYKMVKYFTEERFELKRLLKETGDKYYKDRDATAKIFINSAYGLTITNYLNFNSPAIGAKITAESRAIIDMALNWASGKGVDYWMRLFKERVGKLEEDDEHE